MSFVMALNVSLEAIECGCGHTVYMETTTMTRLQRSHKTFYCTICGEHRYWPGKSDLEKLRGKLATTRDMLDTAIMERNHNEHRRRGELAAKTRIKNRIANGVCPCCQRTFQNLGRHMKSQHPNYVE